MKEINRKQWVELHHDKRFRPKYPSETVVQFVFRNFERNGKTKVLDLGCGAGRHVFFMGNENIVPYGIDFSDEGVNYTKELMKENGLIKYVENITVGSLKELPYENEFFDGIICYGVLYYLDIHAIKQSVEEMRRVLKDGGKLLLVVRSTEDYRYNEDCEKLNDKKTIIISENDKNKCAYSENGMLMHFFEYEELGELFKNFKNVNIDYLKETHDNQRFCDCNFILTAER